MTGPPPDSGLSGGAGGTPSRSPRPKSPTRREQAAIRADLRQQLLDGPRHNIRHSLPGLGVSLAIHLVVLTVAGLTVMRFEKPPAVVPVEGWLGPEAAVVSSDTAPPVEVEIPSLEDELRAAARQAATQRPVEVVDPNAKPQVNPVDVSTSLGGRGGGPGGHSTVGGASGAGSPRGTPGGPPDPAREGLDRALAWIVRQQKPDGHWSMTGPYPEGAESREADTDTGATALSLLALLGDGHSPNSGKHQKAVQKGVAWLVSQQKPDGDLFDGDEQGRSAHFYAHSQGTIALCEALALSGDESLRPAASKATQFLIAAQNPSLGGWKYRPLGADGIGDTSVTGWALMALHTARMAKIDVPPETFLLASSFLDSAQVDIADASRYRYRPDEPAQAAQLWSMSAVGLLCRQWLGWPRHHEAFAKGQIFLTSEVNAPVWEEGQRNVYAWYYTAQTLHNLGGDPWKEWFARTQGLLLKHQSSGGGKTGGSWHPTKPKGAFLEWSTGAGRLYFTVMCVLILETPERHTPIYGGP